MIRLPRDMKLIKFIFENIFNCINHATRLRFMMQVYGLHSYKISLGNLFIYNFLLFDVEIDPYSF